MTLFRSGATSLRLVLAVGERPSHYALDSLPKKRGDAALSGEVLCDTSLLAYALADAVKSRLLATVL